MTRPIALSELRAATGVPGGYLGRRYEDPDWGADYRASGFGLPGGDGSHWRLSYVYPLADRPDPRFDVTAAQSTWLLAREFLRQDDDSTPRHRPGDRVVVLAGPWTIEDAERYGSAFAASHQPADLDLDAVIRWLRSRGM